MDVTKLTNFFTFDLFSPQDYNAIATNSQGITLISPHPSVQQAARLQEQQLQQQQVQVQHQIQQQKQQHHHQQQQHQVCIQFHFCSKNF